MGGNQSQDSVATATAVSSSSSAPGLMRNSVVHSEASERTSASSSSGQDLSSITPLFLSASSRSLSPAPPPSSIRGAEHDTIREEEEREEEEELEDMSEDGNNGASALMTFHSFLSRSLRSAAEGSDFSTDETGGNQQLEGIQHSSSNSSSALQDHDDRRHRARGNGHHHNREHSSSSSSSSSHHNHRHHHHRHHHHHHRHQDGSTHERRSHRSERSRRRYAASDDSQMLDSDPFGLGISWTTLHQRLQALQGDEEEGGVAGQRRHSDLAGSGRHRSSRSHRSRTNGQLFFFRPPDRMISCPYCKKDYLSSEMDSHKSACKTKPRVQFNEDKLLQDSGECSICLDDMLKGDSIARLPCLCIYHLRCLKKWYEKSQTCPAHPELT